MISSMVGNGSILKVAVEWKSHLWLQVSNLYREPSWSASEDMLPLPDTELPTASTHVLHLLPSGWSTAETWGTKFCCGVSRMWPKVARACHTQQ